MGFTNAKLIKIDSDKKPDELAKILKNISSIEYAEPAWDTTKGNTSVVVAVIDTGVDYSHPDLKNNMWVNTKEISGNNKDDDGNGYIDDVKGWDFYFYDNDPFDFNVYSTTPNSSYAYYSDTSMAAPHVAGTAALVLSRNTSTTPTAVKDSITKSVVKLSSLQNKISTGGMVNAAAAVGSVSDNDIPGTTLSGSSVNGSLNMYTDIDDVYNVYFSKGDVVTITLTGSTGTDFDLYLYNKTATTVKNNAGILAYSEKVGTSTEKIVYPIQQDGTYFIDVYSFTGTGNYTLNVKKGLASGTYEDNFGIIPNDGKWKKVSDVNCSGGTYTTANSSGTILTLKFTGTGIQLTSLKNKLQGIAKVTIDSTSYEVDLYSLAGFIL